MGSSDRLRKKYQGTAAWYDILDSPWERVYRRWRPGLTANLHGRILEVGVGTGRNLPAYPAGAQVVAVDLSEAMLTRAQGRVRALQNYFAFVQADALALPFPDSSFDAYLSTFLYCVLPDELQAAALSEMGRILRPGGKFRLLEIVYSQRARIKLGQVLLAPLVKRIYGARFDRTTLARLKDMHDLQITDTRFLKDDTYLLIEGLRK
jgi:ubiquinone/menaquinone biosynthesis C-methylase UbiE